ncbi:hypothetical protein Pyn_33441 [Prunus yedoensis var. nudiflora]|uniref:RING-type domain-containing protein n=1 Tax=Prunus yedoensis var. nudiflora TaxID=2094558 RepID=A0A314Z043_PRUYE|nr:hypothetical protein Pyn_33441 [Prunus yedoensis var. nudiflora]
MPAFDDVLSTLALIMGGPLTLTIFYFCKDRTPNDHFPSDDARHDDLKASRLPSNLGRQARNIAAVQLPRQASIVFTYTVTASPECVICLEEFREGQECRLLAICNHSYHKSCIDQWLAVTESNCPLCRAPAQNVS